MSHHSKCECRRPAAEQHTFPRTPWHPGAGGSGTAPAQDLRHCFQAGEAHSGNSLAVPRSRVVPRRAMSANGPTRTSATPGRNVCF